MNVCFPFDLGIGFHLFYNYIHTSSPLQSPICLSVSKELYHTDVNISISF